MAADARASLAGRLRAEVDFSVVNRAPDEAARVALAYFKERMPTREEIAKLIFENALEVTREDMYVPTTEKWDDWKDGPDGDQCRKQADAILTLLAGTVTG